MYIVLLGPPGSGKGSQGKRLADILKLEHVSTGDLLRNILNDPTHQLYADVAVMNQGKLVSDQVVNACIKDALNNPKYKNGMVFDGYPRTLEQAKELDVMLDDIGKQIDVILNFETDYEILKSRLLGRLVCQDCKKIYHEKQHFTKCQICGGKLIKRKDDNEQTILERFEEYNLKTKPLIDYFKASEGLYLDIVVNDADMTVEEVEEIILEKMEPYFQAGL